MHRRTAGSALIVLLAWVGTSACGDAGGATTRDARSPADTASGEIPFELVGKGGAALVIPVYINGEGPLDFALDTGATFTCVDRSVSERLRLPSPRGVRGMGANSQSSGQMRLVRLDSVRVGSAQAFELMGCELDLAHATRLGIDIDGLLGLNFLKAFHVTLDFERSVMGLRKVRAD